MNTTQITVEATISANRNKVWDFWTKPEHITKWNFDAESENPIEMQLEGWQAILNNFKKYAEANSY